MRIKSVFETCEVVSFLKKRQLLKQYLKARNYITDGYFESVDFKLREPKEKGVWYFRINLQYRAWCYFEGDDLFVFKIDDHS